MQPGLVVQTPPPPAPSPQPESVDTSNWHTYRSDEFGFEFQYPKVFAEDPQCRVKELENGVRVGSRIDILAFATRAV